MGRETPLDLFMCKLQVVHVERGNLGMLQDLDALVGVAKDAVLV
jgi:hypothetical protein